MSEPEVLFYPEGAIASKSADRLHRAKYAASIADHINAWHGRESLVLSIFGDWGCGKTSVKNMIVERLRETIASPPIVVQFEPWQFSGDEQLLGEFFKTIGEALESCVGNNAPALKDPGGWKKIFRSKERRTDADTIATEFKKYGEQLSLGSRLSSAAAVVTAFHSPDHAAEALILAKTLNDVGEIATEAGKAIEVSTKPKTLQDRRESLRKRFENSDRKVVVVIDDIDRLTTAEICLIIRLVKANTNFPKFVFLLLMQRNIATKALESIAGAGQGDKFLEKVVQFPFDLPEPEMAEIHGILWHGIRQQAKGCSAEAEWESLRALKIFTRGVIRYHTNLRQVYRFLNAIAFRIQVFRSEGAFEVNVFDLIGLETLRLNEPEVYAQIPSHKAILATTHHRQKSEYAVVWGSLEKAMKDKDGAQALLAALFPHFEVMTNNMTYGPDFSLEWKREKRVTDEDFFERYFRLVVPSRQVAESDYAAFLQDLDNRDEMLARLKRWQKSGVIENALDRIQSEQKLLERVSDPKPFLMALVDIADEDLGVKDATLGMWLISNHTLIWVHETLKRTKEEPHKIELLRGIMTGSSGLLTVTELVDDLFRERTRPPELPNCDPSQKEEFISILRTRLLEWNKRGALVAHPRLGRIIWAWFRVLPDDAKAWVKDQMAIPESRLPLLRAFLHQTISSSEGEIYSYHLNSLEKFAPLDEWKKMLVELTALSGTSPLDRLAIATLERAFRRKEKGMASDDWGHYGAELGYTKLADYM